MIEISIGIFAKFAQKNDHLVNRVIRVLKADFNHGKM